MLSMQISTNYVLKSVLEVKTYTEIIAAITKNDLSSVV